MTTEDFDARAWLIWVLAAAAVTMLARNPLYSLLMLIASKLVEWSCGREDSALDSKLGRYALVQLAAVVFIFSGLYSALFIHAGQTPIIVLPERIPLLGGPITLEALLSGLSNGLLLLTLLTLFLAFNRVVSADRLARLAPRAFQDLGVVVLVALTYVPETALHVQRIRDAQAVRGKRIEGLRDWQPLLIPLLIGGLERAMTLAEAMVARGFAAGQRTPLSGQMLAGLALAVGLTFAGWIVALWWGLPGWILMSLGILGVLGIVWSAGRAVVTTRYRKRPWQARDTLLAAASLLPLALLALPIGVVDRSSLSFSFLNGLQWPPFDPVIGFLLLLYALPAVYALAGGDNRIEELHDFN